MQGYTHLTCEQRYHIYGLKASGMKGKEIAEVVGVHKATISRELRRNAGLRGYRPKQAHETSQERARGKANARRFTSSDWQTVIACLQEGLSPEQISGRLAMTGQLRISHETIYQHIYQDKRMGGTLVLHLRTQKKRRKRYGSGKERRGCIRNRVGIEHRPAVVEERSRQGDWEGDTIIGHAHQGAVVTLVERKTRYTLAARLDSKEAIPASQAITRLLEPHKKRCHTITFDNGREFAEHENIASRLSCKVFFARPYHSWERGLNENTNGLLRQYLPKSANLKNCSDLEVQSAVDRLNHRPRKCLGFRTPHEVFFNQPSQWSNPLASVALQI